MAIKFNTGVAEGEDAPLTSSREHASGSSRADSAGSNPAPGTSSPFKELPEAKGPRYPDGKKYLVGFIDGTTEYIGTQRMFPAAGTWQMADRYQLFYREGTIKPVGLLHDLLKCAERIEKLRADVDILVIPGKVE